MISNSIDIQNNHESAALDILRVETALSRYPIHRLASKGTINISIKKQDDKGATSLIWEVTYNSKYGQPGPLAYKLDTLVINRKIDDAQRPVPQILKLGSLREIAEELNLGTNTNAVKTALRQNASAFIVAKIKYLSLDRIEKTLEANFTRYNIVFTGEKLPDGRNADCVYLIFNEPFLEVLNNVSRRPLDYDYLRELPPGPQRFYEILSYQMLPAIKYNQRARLLYSEFCLYSTMTRYETFDQVKKQMYKIHQPHVKAGYIYKVEYTQTVDGEGKPDWNIYYVPGERAKFQQLVFSFAIPNNQQLRVKTAPNERKSKAQDSEKNVNFITEQFSMLSNASSSISSNATAVELVKKFYRLRFGEEQEPTERELGEATGYLSQGGDWANHLIEFGAFQGKKTNKFPDVFGGIKKLISQAKEPYDLKSKEKDRAAIKNARQSHENAHTGDYRAFLAELLGGRLEKTIPEAFTAFTTQEKSIYLFHKARASKSPMSASVVEEFYTEEKRISRFIKFVEENPRSGIPSFWQWDEKINPHPYKINT